MSALNSYWRDAANWDGGLAHNFQQARMWSIYVDPDNPCSIVVMTFPGQRVEFDRYDEGGCLDVVSQYPDIYRTNKLWQIQTYKDMFGLDDAI